MVYKILENKFNEDKLQKFESIACQGNGYIGVRNSLEEEYVNTHRNTFINGVFNAPYGEAAELAALPDVTNFEIYINGERFNMLKGTVNEYERSLNMKNGESVRMVTRICKNGVTAKLAFSRFVSQTHKHIVAEQVRILCNSDAEIRVVTGIDGKMTNSGVQHFGPAELRSYHGNRISLCAKTLQSKVTVCAQSVLKCSLDNKYSVKTDRRGVYSCMSLKAERGKELVFEKISAYSTSRDLGFCENDSAEKNCEKYLSEAEKLGYHKLMELSERKWKDFWNTKAIIIDSDNDFYQKAVNFALYHLYIMASGEDSRLGIGAKAMSGEGYKGHSFWDTEIFILPYYIYNEPQTARKLLEYRYGLLEASRKKAKEYGFDGAMYPWEGAWADDGETCPRLGDMDLETGERRVNYMGEKEVHINADIAYAVWHYYTATGDKEFMEKYGCEMILSTAKFWLSRVVERNRRFEILDVIGPDEYKDGIDNNAYTNYMAYFNLCLAQKIIDNISEEYKNKLKIDTDKMKSRLQEVTEHIYIPKPDADGIIEQLDGFRALKDVDYSLYKNKEKVGAIFDDYSFEEINTMRVCKQADLVMLFYTLPDIFDRKTVKRNFEYYENCTLHDSSLSLCIHSLMASRLNMTDTSIELFKKCCEVDLGDNTDNSDNGIHSASIGGIWLAATMGFGGVRAENDALIAEPVLPKGITGYSLSIMYRGTQYRLTVDENRADIERIIGEEQTVILNGNKIEA